MFVSKKCFVSITLVLILFMVVVLPWINHLNDIYIGVSMSPDTSFFYTPQAFYQMLNDYGSDGRRAYLIIRWTFDLVYPFVYGIFFYLVLDKLRLKNWVLSLPVLAVVFDFCENIIASYFMIFYEDELDALVYLLQVVSLLKWLMILVIVIMIIYGLFKKTIKHES